MLAVEMRHITKRFGGVIANDDVSLTVRSGEIHALVGENGAGKTTLMNILYGLEAADAGEIAVRGERALIDSPSAAIALSIGMVHQHFMLIPPLTVAENIMLGNERKRAGFLLDRRRASDEIATLAGQFGIAVPPGSRVDTLSVGLQQRVEILKLLYRQASILILDEPTAVLAPQEIESLFASLRTLKNQGKTVILITHRLAEVMEISDRVTVMRRGRIEGEVETASTNRLELARMMVGKDWEGRERTPSPPGHNAVLAVRGVSALNDRGLPALHQVSLTISAGEILGVAAVEGNGQSELVEVISGRRHPSSGSVEILTPAARGSRPAVAHIPEDRLRDGMIGEFSLAENLVLGRLSTEEFSSHGIIRRRTINRFAERAILEFDIRPPEPMRTLGHFSGGNQQKAVIARELSKNAPLLIASHPTRGLDIGATDFVHHALTEEKQRGKAILLLSSDLGEFLLLSDRIAVLFKGEIVALLDSSQTSERELGAYMTGARARETA